MTFRNILLATALSVLAPVAQANALPPLSQEQYINDRLIAARVADRIRRTCPTLDARMVYAFTQARALKRYAEDKGYSEEQINAFLDSKPDKKRIYARAEAYLTQNGAREADPQTFCRIGEAEIAAKSVAGSLLVAK